MTTIIYTCPYVPAEWIAAHGLRPSRVIPASLDSASSIARTEGVCPYVRSFIGEVVENKRAGGVVVTTVCDQMRRAFDILARRCELPTFLMNVSSTWQSLAAQKLYLDEFKRLSRFLTRQGGKPPSNDALAGIMLEYDRARTSILEARGYMSARRYAETIAAFGRAGPREMPDNGAGPELLTGGIPLAIIGGPLMRQDFDILDVAERFGGRIVLNATETGERGMCVPFDRRGLRDDPLAELAGAYFGGIQDASRRPNSELYKWLKRELAGRAVRGIIFFRYLWCDTWHAELRRLKDWIDLPVLDIDVAGDSQTDRPRRANRIRAFLEMLQ
ncbi:MAG: 2-hydroxyacyl-CoA dehydratase family protein [Phycisphaerales bacterium]|jgi:benzoyl-CoA reductase/2-hydroxyglutaryl-CoA dehydratase subunit BcrC/BadD/HgdB